MASRPDPPQRKRAPAVQPIQIRRLAGTLTLMMPVPLCSPKRDARIDVATGLASGRACHAFGAGTEGAIAGNAGVPALEAIGEIRCRGRTDAGCHRRRGCQCGRHDHHRKAHGLVCFASWIPGLRLKPLRRVVTHPQMFNCTSGEQPTTISLVSRNCSASRF